MINGVYNPLFLSVEWSELDSPILHMSILRSFKLSVPSSETVGWHHGGGGVSEADARLELHAGDARRRSSTFLVKNPASVPSRPCGAR